MGRKQIAPAAAGPSPRLSVVMPVRDAGPYLDESVASVLGQSHGDFRFIIRDDGSRDGSAERLRQWAARDPRIELHLGDRPLGPAASSQWVVRQAGSPLVARMDADDVAHPERLRRQLAALDAAPEACLVGTLWVGIDAGGRRVRPCDRSRLARTGPFAPFPHGSIMFRREAFDRAGGYRTECNYWEDADLYRRLAALGKLLVIPEPLYAHRASTLSTRLASPSEEVEKAVDLMYRTLGGLGGAAPRDGKVLPIVFVLLGSTVLWAGARPRVLGRVLRRAQLRFDVQSAAVLAWALWSMLSPGTLRSALRAAAQLRDRRHRARFADGAPVEWSPLAAPANAEAAAELAGPAVC